MNPMDSLINAMVALLTLVASAIHGDETRIRSWDGTNLRTDWGGLIYQATCKSSIAWTAGPAPTRVLSGPYRPQDKGGQSDFQFGMRIMAWRAAPAPPAVTYPNCGLPPIWEREQGTEGGDFYWDWWNDAHTLSFRRGSRAAGGQWTWRQDDFAITSAKAIGWGIFPD